MSRAASTFFSAVDKPADSLAGIRVRADVSACTDVSVDSPCSGLSSGSVLQPEALPVSDSGSSVGQRLRAVMPSKDDFAYNPHGPLIITRNPVAPHQVGVVRRQRKV